MLRAVPVALLAMLLTLTQANAQQVTEETPQAGEDAAEEEGSGKESAAGGPAPAKPDPWSGKAALGYLATSGNTESSSLNSGFAIAYTAGRWVHGLNLSAISTTEMDDTVAEAYAAGWKSEYSVTEDDFLFLRANWRRDRFSGYEHQLSESVGYGRRLIDTTNHFLSAEIGAGARQAELSDGVREDSFIFRGGINYRWQVNDTVRFTQDFAAETAPDNTYFESISAIKSNLFSDLALVASYTIKNNSTVPLGNENTDTYTALSVEYAF